MTRSYSRIFRTAAAAVLVLSPVVFSASCGKAMLKQGDGASYLIVDALQAAPGATPSELSSMLASDVVTVKGGVTTVFADPGQVQMHVAIKDTTTGVTPTDVNSITLTGYHVDYVRSDGGTGVPPSFDGSLTSTVTSSTTTVPFILVNAQAKGVAPLVGLVNSLNHVVVVAHVTFVGHDQTGHSVTVEANITIDFADWLDAA